jgi:hypothetical protein
MSRAPSLGISLLAPLLAAATPAHAAIPIPEPPVPQRVALADCVVVGEVAEVKPEPVHAAPDVKVPGAPKVPYRMAVIRAETVVVGPRDLREVQVGFVAAPRPGGPRQAAFRWTRGQEACFFLRKHPDEPFFVVRAGWDVLPKKGAEEFARARALVQRCARLLDDPLAGLRAKGADERLLTAAMLIFRYRTAQFVYRGEPRTEPIDAEQSRLILSALAEGSWSVREVYGPMGRLRLFYRLGLTEKDGWRPEAAKDVPGAARAWLRANAATYRIRRYAPPE